MNRQLLRQFAQAGVVERLREMQRELEMLAQEFPDIVRNADGALPSLIPIRKKKGAHAVRLERKRTPQKPLEARQADIRAYLATHPGATVKQIAAAIGLGANTEMRKILRSVATEKKGPGKSHERLWTLKGTKSAKKSATKRRTRRPSPAPTVVTASDEPSNGNRLNGKPSKQQQKRELTAAFLAQFDTTTPTKPPAGRENAMGPYVRRGYLRSKEDGYVRTAKPFSVSPR